MVGRNGSPAWSAAIAPSLRQLERRRAPSLAQGSGGDADLGGTFPIHEKVGRPLGVEKSVAAWRSCCGSTFSPAADQLVPTTGPVWVRTEQVGGLGEPLMSGSSGRAGCPAPAVGDRLRLAAPEGGPGRAEIIDERREVAGRRAPPPGGLMIATARR
jgi:hypothetical protein